jgi:lipopolysaccharide biosynthesis glycosyltransferase
VEKQKEKKIVGVAFDDNYLFPFLLLAFSIFKNSKELPEIRVANVNGTLSQPSKRILDRFTSILGMKIDVLEAFLPDTLAINARLSIAAYGRLWLADHISEDFVYIDTDSLVMPGWESIFDFLILLEENRDLLLAAMPALGNKTPPWPIEIGDKTQYRFHSSILVISHRNWTVHFANEKNLPWEKIALLSAELGITQHDPSILEFTADQSILQFAAKGKYLPLPDDLVNFGTKFSNSTKIISSGTWVKPWTVKKENYLRYLSSLMMYQNYSDVFGVVRELDLFTRFEEEMFDFLAKDPVLLEEVSAIQKKSQNPWGFHISAPFLMGKFVFVAMTYARKFFNILKFWQ